MSICFSSISVPALPAYPRTELDNHTDALFKVIEASHSRCAAVQTMRTLRWSFGVFCGIEQPRMPSNGPRLDRHQQVSNVPQPNVSATTPKAEYGVSKISGASRRPSTRRRPEHKLLRPSVLRDAPGNFSSFPDPGAQKSALPPIFYR